MICLTPCLDTEGQWGEGISPRAWYRAGFQKRGSSRSKGGLGASGSYRGHNPFIIDSQPEMTAPSALSAQG